MEMLIQLNVLTGITFTSPTGIIGNYNHSKYKTYWVISCNYTPNYQISSDMNVIFTI